MIESHSLYRLDKCDNHLLKAILISKLLKLILAQLLPFLICHNRGLRACRRLCMGISRGALIIKDAFVLRAPPEEILHKVREAYFYDCLEQSVYHALSLNAKGSSPNVKSVDNVLHIGGVSMFCDTGFQPIIEHLPSVK